MSDTPRTDAVELLHHKTVNLCRQLERELAEARVALRAKGCACDKHDLVGGWACTRCLANAEAKNAKHEEQIKSGELIPANVVKEWAYDGLMDLIPLKQFAAKKASRE